MIQPFAIATSPALCSETVARNPPVPTGRKSGVPVDQLYPGYSELVLQNQRLVRKVAWQVHRRVSSAIDIADLIQVGLIALIEAAQSYEDRGYRFSTYASLRIRGAMIDELRRAATISRTAMSRIREVAALRKAIENSEGRPASDTEIAHALGISMAGYRAIACEAQGVRNESINDLYSDRSLWFADDAMAADEAIDRNRLATYVAEAIGQLPDREARVLHLYFTEERNLSEIGILLNIGAARVCQIKKAAIDRLKTKLVERVGYRPCAVNDIEANCRGDTRSV